MTLPIQKDLDTSVSLTFPEDNGIPFFQDFSFWRGVPSGVKFYIQEYINGSYKLVGEGYGMKDAYGCGAIYIRGEVLFPST